VIESAAIVLALARSARKILVMGKTQGSMGGLCAPHGGALRCIPWLVAGLLVACGESDSTGSGPTQGVGGAFGTPWPSGSGGEVLEPVDSSTDLIFSHTRGFY
jgi:hypothetical protein